MNSEPNNLQDLQELIISSNYQESENKAWSIPVQILIDQYENSQDNDILCSGNFSILIQPEKLSNVESDTSRKFRRVAKSSLRSRGTSTLHYCEHCNKEFNSKALFVRHLKSHSADYPFKCDDCEKSYKYKWLRDKHIKWKHCSTPPKKSDNFDQNKGGKIHECNICGKSYPYMSAYILHLKSHQDVKEHFCPKNGCSKSYRTMSHLNDHIRSHDKGFVCGDCAKKFKSRSGLKSHIKVAHNGVKFTGSESSQETLESEIDLLKKSGEVVKIYDGESRYVDVMSMGDEDVPTEKYIACDMVNGNKLYRCVVCPKVRSTNIYSVITHVCMEHTLERISEKIIADKYHRIS